MTPSVFTALLVACGLAFIQCADRPAGHYRTRGVVQAIHTQDGASELSIQHEAVPNFADRDQQRATMPSMVMTFGLAPQLSAAGIHIGDKLTFEFDVRYDKRPVLLVSKLDKLPSDTGLVLAAPR